VRDVGSRARVGATRGETPTSGCNVAADATAELAAHSAIIKQLGAVTGSSHGS
jgi:hypothetical protein